MDEEQTRNLEDERIEKLVTDEVLENAALRAREKRDETQDETIKRILDSELITASDLLTRINTR